MPNKKISDLPAVAAAAAADLIEVEQGGVSKKETLTQVFAIGKVVAGARVNQGLVFGIAKAATDSGLFLATVTLDGTAGPASINLEINGVLQYQVAVNVVGTVSIEISYYVNSGDTIKLVDFSDPNPGNAIGDNFILPLKTSA